MIKRIDLPLYGENDAVEEHRRDMKSARQRNQLFEIEEGYWPQQENGDGISDRQIARPSQVLCLSNSPQRHDDE
jgi:hypothetical protein